MLLEKQMSVRTLPLPFVSPPEVFLTSAITSFTTGFLSHLRDRRHLGSWEAELRMCPLGTSVAFSKLSRALAEKKSRVQKDLMLTSLKPP